MHYDAYQFVESIRDRFWLAMLSAIDAALISCARWPSVHARGGASRLGSDVAYMRFLIATRTYLLAEGRMRPEGLENDQFMLLKPLCQHLVDQGRFPPDRMALFTELEQWLLRNAGDASGHVPEQKSHA